jgi:hypothetical protein
MMCRLPETKRGERRCDNRKVRDGIRSNPRPQAKPRRAARGAAKAFRDRPARSRLVPWHVLTLAEFTAECPRGSARSCPPES